MHTNPFDAALQKVTSERCVTERGRRSGMLAVRFALDSCLTSFAINGFVAIDNRCKLVSGYLLVDGLVGMGSSVVCAARNDEVTFVGTFGGSLTSSLADALRVAQPVAERERLLDVVCASIDSYL